MRVIHTYYDHGRLLCGNCNKKFGAPCYSYEMKYIEYENKSTHTYAMCPYCNIEGIISEVVRGDLENCISCSKSIMTDGKKVKDNGRIKDCKDLMWSLNCAITDQDLFHWFIISTNDEFADGCPNWERRSEIKSVDIPSPIQLLSRKKFEDLVEEVINYYPFREKVADCNDDQDIADDILNNINRKLNRSLD